MSYKEKQLSANEVKKSLKKIAKDASLSALGRPKSIAQGRGERDAHSGREIKVGPGGRPSSLKSVNNEDGLNSDCLEGDPKAH